MTDSEDPKTGLLDVPPRVVNVGLESFADDLQSFGADVVHVDWTPPAGGDGGLAALLSMDMEKIEAANQEALRRMLSADPVLIDVLPAADVLSGLEDRMILHAGPPIEWPRMSGPLRGAVIGALIYEGLANSREQAIHLIERGEEKFGDDSEYPKI